MNKWARANYQPCLPLGTNGARATGSDLHIELSRRAAQEGIVLLKNNNNALPLKKGQKIAIFGKAQIDYVKGGGGSGDVHTAYTRNLYDAFKTKKNIEIFNELSLFYQNYCEEESKTAPAPGMIGEPVLPQSILDKAAEFTDTAIITICRFSGEGWDRKNNEEDDYFYLSNNEKEMVNSVCEKFKHIIVLLNTGAMTDTSWFAYNDKIESALLIWQGGMEGALAAADVLTGEVSPSGKLVDTCAASFDDYPSSANFHESDDFVDYDDDIFVGYRYFETIPEADKKVVYPFGYGLSYTDFEISDVNINTNKTKAIVSVTVKNIGKFAGKEVVQVYYSAPTGIISKPKKELCAFAKTPLLKPGKSCDIIMSFNISDMASYDDLGQIKKSAYILEKGDYKFFVGNSVRSAKENEYKLSVNEDIIVEQLTELCPPRALKRRLLADGSYIDAVNTDRERISYDCKYKFAEKPDEKKMLIDVVNGDVTLDEFIAQLSDEELILMVSGQPNLGVANTFGMGGIKEYGIPRVMTADGPAGVRIEKACGVSTTAFPVASMLASTWNLDLVEEIGKTGAIEIKENNLAVWLTPALNIHRSPLCGRNFEYFSEDPFVSGKMAAAITRGIQSENISACPKHFACNNKETNRQESDSRLSERALREIYIKGFEICVKEAAPKMIMTSYNIMNGIYTSENAELITGILRGEWGYEGMITTDWWNTSNHIKETKAGNDIKMPESRENEYLKELKAGNITREQIAVCAKRVLEMIMFID